MTFNEKRAHDLALVSLKFAMQPDALAAEALAAGSTTVGVDIYAKYKLAYEAALEALNRDFPEGID